MYGPLPHYDLMYWPKIRSSSKFRDMIYFSTFLKMSVTMISCTSPSSSFSFSTRVVRSSSESQPADLKCELWTNNEKLLTTNFPLLFHLLEQSITFLHFLDAGSFVVWNNSNFIFCYSIGTQWCRNEGQSAEKEALQGWLWYMVS